MASRRRVDWTALRNDLSNRCFICDLLAQRPGVEHEVLYQNADVIVFLSKYPWVFGHVLVAPKAHVEAVTGDFKLDQYLALQRVVYRVAEAVRQEVPVERMYILSLGSQQGNAHVHWHVAPLPPGIPPTEQQFAALDRDDVVDLSPDEVDALAARLRARLAASPID